jgi:hypothetical protein
MPAVVGLHNGLARLGRLARELVEHWTRGDDAGVGFL